MVRGWTIEPQSIAPFKWWSKMLVWSYARAPIPLWQCNQLYVATWQLRWVLSKVTNANPADRHLWSTPILTYAQVALLKGFEGVMWLHPNHACGPCWTPAPVSFWRLPKAASGARQRANTSRGQFDGHGPMFVSDLETSTDQTNTTMAKHFGDSSIIIIHLSNQSRYDTFKKSICACVRLHRFKSPRNMSASNLWNPEAVGIQCEWRCGIEFSEFVFGSEIMLISAVLMRIHIIHPIYMYVAYIYIYIYKLSLSC